MPKPLFHSFTYRDVFAVIISSKLDSELQFVTTESLLLDERS